MRTFTVVVHHEPEGGCWGKFLTSGVFSQGETVDELLGTSRPRSRCISKTATTTADNP
jgi:hypothetical protein